MGECLSSNDVGWQEASQEPSKSDLVDGVITFCHAQLEMYRCAGGKKPLKFKAAELKRQEIFRTLTKEQKRDACLVASGIVAMCSG